MKALAFLTGSAYLILFIVTIVVIALIDVSLIRILEVKGFGLMLIALPIIGIGLLLASTEFDTIRIERKK